MSDITSNKKEHGTPQDAEHLFMANALERQSSEIRSYEIGLGHYEKLSVLQAGVLALSVTFLAGVGSQATAHHASVLHARVLVTCWIALLSSILLCIVRNWLSTKGLKFMNTAWGIGNQKSVLRLAGEPPLRDSTRSLLKQLSDTGILDEWKCEAAKKSVRLDKVADCLEYVIHILFFAALLCLGVFGITNIGVFVS